MADLDIPVGGVLVNRVYLHRRRQFPQPISQIESLKPGFLIHAYAKTFHGQHFKVDANGNCRVTVIDTLTGIKKEVILEVTEIIPSPGFPLAAKTLDNLVFASYSKDELPSYKTWYTAADMREINPPPAMSIGDKVDAAVAARRLKELKAKAMDNEQKLQMLDALPDEAHYSAQLERFSAMLGDYRKTDGENARHLSSILKEQFTTPQISLLFPTLDIDGDLDKIQKANKIRYEAALGPNGAFHGGSDNLCTKLTMLHYGLPIAPMTLENVVRAGIDSTVSDPVESNTNAADRRLQVLWQQQPLEFLDTYHERLFAYGGLRVLPAKPVQAVSKGIPNVDRAPTTMTKAAAVHIRGGADPSYVDEEMSEDDAADSEVSDGDEFQPHDDSVDDGIYDVSDNEPKPSPTRAERPTTRSKPQLATAAQIRETMFADARAEKNPQIAMNKKIYLDSVMSKPGPNETRADAAAKRAIYENTFMPFAKRRRGQNLDPAKESAKVLNDGLEEDSMLSAMRWNAHRLEEEKRSQERRDAWTKVQSIQKQDGSYEVPFLGETLEFKINAGGQMPTIYVAPVTASFNAKLTEQLKRAHNMVLQRAIPCLICEMEFPITHDYNKEVLAHFKGHADQLAAAKKALQGQVMTTVRPNLAPTLLSTPSKPVGFQCTWPGCGAKIGIAGLSIEMAQDKRSALVKNKQHALDHLAFHRTSANESGLGAIPCIHGDHPNLNCKEGMPFVEDIYFHMANHVETAKPPLFACSFPGCTMVLKGGGSDAEGYATRHIEGHLKDHSTNQATPCSVPNCAVQDLCTTTSFPDNTASGQTSSMSLYDHMQNHFPFKCTFPAIGGKECGQIIGQHATATGAGGKASAISHIRRHRLEIARLAVIAIGNGEPAPTYPCTEKDSVTNLACPEALPDEEAVFQHMIQHTSYPGTTQASAPSANLAKNKKPVSKKMSLTKPVVENTMAPPKSPRKRKLEPLVDGITPTLPDGPIVTDHHPQVDSTDTRARSPRKRVVTDGMSLTDELAQGPYRTRASVRDATSVSPTKRSRQSDEK